MTQRGGKRVGSGRKKATRTIKKEMMREYFVERVRAEMGPILDAQIALAVGVRIAGEEGVYTKAPDHNAAKYLIDQAIGKAKETVDQNVRAEMPLSFLLQQALEVSRERSAQQLPVVTGTVERVVSAY